MSDVMKKYIEDAESALLHTYNRYQIVLDKGEGVYLYDLDGKKYLDFVSGIAVFALGIAGGLAPREAAYLANLAASVVVGKLGTYAVSKEELEHVLLQQMQEEMKK